MCIMDGENMGGDRENIVRELLCRPQSGNLAERIQRAKQARQLGIELRKAKGQRLGTGEFSKWRANQ